MKQFLRQMHADEKIGQGLVHLQCAGTSSLVVAGLARSFARLSFDPSLLLLLTKYEVLITVFQKLVYEVTVLR